MYTIDTQPRKGFEIDGYGWPRQGVGLYVLYILYILRVLYETIILIILTPVNFSRSLQIFELENQNILMLYISSDFHHAGSHVDNSPAPVALHVQDTRLSFCSKSTSP